MDRISARSMALASMWMEHCLRIMELCGDRGLGRTSEAHAGTITGLADDQALGSATLHRPRPALVWGAAPEEKKRQSTQWLVS